MCYTFYSSSSSFPSTLTQEDISSSIGREIGSGDDSLDNTLAIFALSSACGFERDDGLVEGVPMSDERLEVDFALRDECDGQWVVTRL